MPGETPTDDAAMHELSIVDALIDQVRQDVQRSGHEGPVRRLDLTVGRLAGVCCDSIRFAFELLVPGTPLEGAELHIAETRAACRCRACGETVEIDDQIAALRADCPRCGSTDVRIEGGRELLLQSIEIEDQKG